MISLNAKIRDNSSGGVDKIRESGRIPAVVYGHKVKNALLVVDYKEFQEVYKETGESSLIELSVSGEKDLPAGRQEKRLVLVHELQKNPVTDKFIHIDFFQASLTEEVEVDVPLVFEGISMAVKELGGTLVKNISELKIKALPQNLPHDIKVNIESLRTFEDHIAVKNLILPNNIKTLLKAEEIVVSVSEPEKVEEELAREITEDVESVGKAVKEKKEDEVVEDAQAPKSTEEKKEKK